MQKHEAGRLPIMYFRRLSHRRWPSIRPLSSEKKGMTKEARQIGRHEREPRYVCLCACVFLPSGECFGAKWSTVQFIGACWLKPETRGCSSQPDAIVALSFAHAGGHRGTGVPVFATAGHWT